MKLASKTILTFSGFLAIGVLVSLIVSFSPIEANADWQYNKQIPEITGTITVDRTQNYEDLSKLLLVRYIAQGTLWKMNDIFQLTIELYDTKESKVLWIDRWQEKWNNLPLIKGNLSDGLLKALDTKPKLENKVDTSNTEAYEFYLKAKHKYDKRENMEA